MKKKYIFMNFHLFEADIVQEYLHEMAKQGWMLKKLRYGFTVFEACEPQDAYFTIEIYEKGSVLNPYFVPEEQVQYSDFIESYGYELIYTYANYQVYKTTEELDLPIHSVIDEKMKKRKQRAILKHEAYMYLLILLLPLLNVLWMRDFISLSVYQNTTSFLLRLLNIPLYILIILRAIPVLHWMVVKDHYHISIQHMRRRDIFYAVSFLSLLILFAGTICFSSHAIFSFLFLFFAWITFICFPVFLGLDAIFSHWIKKFHSALAFFIAIVLGSILPINMITNSFLNMPIEEISVHDAQLHGSDFQSDLPPLTSNEVTEQDSIFLTAQHYDERYQCRDNYKGFTIFCDTFHYTLYTIKYTPFQDHIKSLILHQKDQALTYQGNILDWQWYQAKNNEVYLVNSNQLIILSMPMFSPTQLQLEEVIEKLSIKNT